MSVTNIDRVDGVRAREQSTSLWLGTLLIASITTIGVAITVVVTAAGARATTGASAETAALNAIARGVIVGIPLAVGLYAWRRPAHERFGRLLLAFGALWFLAGLSTSSSSVLFSIGRVAGWISEVGLVYTVLAFPQGRVTGRIDRALVAWAFSAMALYLVSVPLVAHYPAPAPWTKKKP